MEFSHRFFRNDACRYFPCHETDAPQDFNCLFCFCPLYFLGPACGGDFRMTSSGVKDCTPCLKPHRPEGYDEIVAALTAMSRKKKKKP